MPAAESLETVPPICSNRAMNRTPTETALSKAMIRWSLSRASLVAETPNSLLYRVEQNGRDPAALKQLKPAAGDEELRGSALLAWYGGEGAATVFDSVDGILFMEWLDGATLGEAARQDRDEDATAATQPSDTVMDMLAARGLVDAEAWKAKRQSRIARKIEKQNQAAAAAAATADEGAGA